VEQRQFLFLTVRRPVHPHTIKMPSGVALPVFPKGESIRIQLR